jgi:two-component system sensor histidine kinase UhpB
MKNDRTAKNKAIKKSQLQVTDLEAAVQGLQRKSDNLTDSESRYKLLADHMVDHVFILDLEGNTKFVSPFAKTLLGYSDEEADNWVVGQNITPASLEVGAEVFQEIFACAKRGKKDLYKSWTLQTEVMRKDGSTVWTESNIKLLCDTRGQPLGILGIARDITQRKQAEEALKRSESQLRLLSWRILEIQEKERARIARDLHDQLGQEIVYLKMKAVMLAEQLSSGSVMHNQAMELVNLADQLQNDSHRIAANIRPGMLDDLGLSKAVQWYAEEFERNTGLSCIVDTSAAQMDVPPPIATAAYRILQEALTNIWKHANAVQVEIEVITQVETVVLSISDDGIGFDHHSVLKRGALGLLGMQERAQLAGGKLTMSSSPGKGTNITVILPRCIPQTEAVTNESARLPFDEL